MLQLAASLAVRDGGPPQAILGLSEALSALGVDNLVATTNADGKRARENVALRKIIHVGGADVIYFPVHWPRRLKASIRLMTFVAREARQRDVIHIHGLYLFSTLLGLYVSRLYGKPYVLVPHGGLQPYHQRKSRYLKRLFDASVGRDLVCGAATVVCASDSEAGAAYARGARRVDVIPHGVTSIGERAGPDGARLLREIPSGALVVLFLGRFTTKKNPDLLLRVWSRVRPTRTALLLMVGPDDSFTANELRAEAERLGCSSSVRVCGPVGGGDRHALMRRADLFVLPSESENFGMTIPEALAAGTACMVSAGVGSGWAVRESQAGWVLPVLEESAWLAALTSALSDQSHLVELGQLARRYAANRFDWEDIAARYIQIYDAIVRQDSRNDRGARRTRLSEGAIAIGPLIGPSETKGR